jgi:hypothetical protein
MTLYSHLCTAASTAAAEVVHMARSTGAARAPVLASHRLMMYSVCSVRSRTSVLQTCQLRGVLRTVSGVRALSGQQRRPRQCINDRCPTVWTRLSK